MPKRTVETLFFHFSQNNSGGSFDHDPEKGIGHNVIVEALNEKDALDRAEAIGLYFDGSGDCECCGRRWSDYVRDGSKTPHIYDQDVSKGVFQAGYMFGLDRSYIHYLNGKIKTVKHVEKKS